MRKTLGIAILGLWVLGFTTAGCEVLKQRDTPTNLATGYTAVEQLRLQTADMLRQNQIGKQDAQQVLSFSDKATRILDKATEAHFAGNKDAPRKGLEMSEVILNEAYGLLRGRIEERKARVK